MNGKLRWAFGTLFSLLPACGGESTTEATSGVQYGNPCPAMALCDRSCKPGRSTVLCLSLAPGDSATASLSGFSFGYAEALTLVVWYEEKGDAAQTDIELDGRPAFEQTAIPATMDGSKVDPAHYLYVLDFGPSAQMVEVKNTAAAAGSSIEVAEAYYFTTHGDACPFAAPDPKLTCAE